MGQESSEQKKNSQGHLWILFNETGNNENKLTDRCERNPYQCYIKNTKYLAHKTVSKQLFRK